MSALNTAVGCQAGAQNTIGSGNTFIGRNAGHSNTTEGNNTFVGSDTNGAPNIIQSTAIGFGAIVTQSNSVVLGSSTAIVGIGTSAPKARLHVQGTILVGNPGSGIILKAPNGTTCRLLIIDNTGALQVLPTVCP